jgi:hypothetical protein
MNMPEVNEVVYYPRQVTLPPDKVNPVSVIQGTIPRNMPAYQEALEHVQVAFVHDSPQTFNESKIVTLLEAWKGLTNIGRTSDNPLTGLVPIAKRFNVYVNLLQGIDQRAPTNNSFNASASYLLEYCWLRSIKYSPLDKSGQAAVHTITVSLQPQQIIPLRDKTIKN